MWKPVCCQQISHAGNSLDPFTSALAPCVPRCLLIFRILCQVSTACSLFKVEPLTQPSLELLKGKPGGKCHFLLVPLLLSCLGRILWNKTFLSFISVVLVMTGCHSLFCFETGSCYVLHWPGLEATQVCAKILLHQPSPLD